MGESQGGGGCETGSRAQDSGTRRARETGGDERGDHLFVIERVVYEDECAEEEEETDAEKDA